jgi:hypothetical protein
LAGKIQAKAKICCTRLSGIECVCVVCMCAKQIDHASQREKKKRAKGPLPLSVCLACDFSPDTTLSRFLPGAISVAGYRDEQERSMVRERATKKRRRGVGGGGMNERT